MAPSRSSLLRAALAAALLFISLPFPAAAHAELASTSPADGETVVGSPAVVVATFTDALAAQSSLELRDASGATVASGGVDPADPESLRIAAPDLAPGTYEGRITWFSADGHGPERATFTFTVTAPPTPTPTPTPPPSAAPSPTPTPSPTPAATASPTPAPSPAPSDPTGGTTDVLIPIVAAVVLLGAFGAWLLRRRGGGA